MTDRHLAAGDFLERLERIASAGAEGIILREKDLPEPEYRDLARRAQKVCKEKLILHTFWKTAQELSIRRIHLPFRDFLALTGADRTWFHTIGVSVHTVEEAEEAQARGASYVTAGHIYATDCKKGVPPKGLSFLEAVCRAARIPVYAIGGIGPGQAPRCIEAGAAGVCLRSSLMRAEDPKAYLDRF